MKRNGKTMKKEMRGGKVRDGSYRPSVKGRKPNKLTLAWPPVSPKTSFKNPNLPVKTVPISPKFPTQFGNFVNRHNIITPPQKTQARKALTPLLSTSKGATLTPITPITSFAQELTKNSVYLTSDEQGQRKNSLYELVHPSNNSSDKNISLNKPQTSDKIVNMTLQQLAKMYNKPIYSELAVGDSKTLPPSQGTSDAQAYIASLA